MLTYGGVELAFPDAEGELSKWLRDHQPLEDTVAVSDRRLSEISPRHGLQSWYGVRKGIGQTIANYPSAPPPRLNTLYWPTGATRWARGYFLASGDAKNAIVKLAHNAGGNSPLLLKMGEDAGSYLSTEMYLLPPRPVSRIATAAGQVDESLYILPLVDVRYWWQFASVDDLEVTTSTTWVSLFGTLGAKLGVTVTLPTAVTSAYLQPDPIEFTRRFDNAAATLDAAALSVGKRIVRRIDGVVRAESPADAVTVNAANYNTGTWQLVCGGEFTNEAGDVPASVVTTFRKWRHYALLQKGQVYTESKAAASSIVVSGSEAVIHSTAFANCNSSDSSPSNTSELASLATAIGEDFYAWKVKRHDYTFSGIKAWHPSGFDDAVNWEFGRQVDGIYRAQSRVQTLPADFGFDLQLSQFSTMRLFEPIVIGKTDAAIAAGSTGTVSVWTGRSGAEIDSGLNIEVTAQYAVAANVAIIAEWINDDWYLSTSLRSLAIAKLRYPLCGNTADIEEFRYYDGTVPADLPTIARNNEYRHRGLAGDQVELEQIKIGDTWHWLVTNVTGHDYPVLTEVRRRNYNCDDPCIEGGYVTARLEICNTALTWRDLNCIPCESTSEATSDATSEVQGSPEYPPATSSGGCNIEDLNDEMFFESGESIITGSNTLNVSITHDNPCHSPDPMGSASEPSPRTGGNGSPGLAVVEDVPNFIFSESVVVSCDRRRDIVTNELLSADPDDKEWRVSIRIGANTPPNTVSSLFRITETQGASWQNTPSTIAFVPCAGNLLILSLNPFHAIANLAPPFYPFYDWTCGPAQYEITE